MIAVDGTKLAASASDGAIRTYEQIATEILAEAGRIDAAEDELHGDARGDELPEGLIRAQWRRLAAGRKPQLRRRFLVGSGGRQHRLHVPISNHTREVTPG